MLLQVFQYSYKISLYERRSYRGGQINFTLQSWALLPPERLSFLTKNPNPRKSTHDTVKDRRCLPSETGWCLLTESGTMGAELQSLISKLGQGRFPQLSYAGEKWKPDFLTKGWFHQFWMEPKLSSDIDSTAYYIISYILELYYKGYSHEDYFKQCYYTLC